MFKNPYVHAILHEVRLKFSSTDWRIKLTTFLSSLAKYNTLDVKSTSNDSYAIILTIPFQSWATMAEIWIFLREITHFSSLDKRFDHGSQMNALPFIRTQHGYIIIADVLNLDVAVIGPWVWSFIWGVYKWSKASWIHPWSILFL